MEEVIKIYNFNVNGVDYFFDDEKCYDLELDEQISDLHLLHFIFPDTEFHVLISTNNKGFIDFGSGAEFTSFLRERGVDYRPYECLKYEHERAPDRIKITLKGGIKFLLAMMPPNHFKAKGIFEYSVPNTKLNFKKTLIKNAYLNWTGDEIDGKHPELFQKYLNKQTTKRNIFIFNFLAIVAFVIWFYMYML